MIYFDDLPLSEDILAALSELKIEYVFQPIFYPDGKTIYAREALMRPHDKDVMELITEYQEQDKLHILEVATLFGATQAYFMRGYKEILSINTFPCEIFTEEEVNAYIEYFGEDKKAMILETLEYPYLSIDIAEAKGFFTSKERADAINSTLLGIRPYVAIDDTMMCFPLAPMMNYLTHTRPAGGTCWIGEDGDFILPIERTPRILFNKTFFSGDNWYEIYKLDGKYGFDILSFIKRHRYRKVYENDYFMLFVPPVPVRNEI